MSVLDWEHLGVQLLERERRPVFVLDNEGRVQRTNRAFLSLLPDGSRTHGVDFERDWLAEPSRQTFASALKVARTKGRGHATVALVNTLFPLDLVLELVRLGEGRSAAVMAVMVDAVSRSPGLPIRPATGVTYEVAVGEDGSRTLTRFLAATDHPMAPLDPRAPCWRQVFGRATECTACPVRELENCRRASVVLDDGAAMFSPWLLVAERGGDRATVTALRIDETAWSELTRTRVDRVASASGLTAREHEVLSLLIMGRALEDIATAVGVTVRMAKYLQQKILKKTGADSRLDLVRLIL